MQLACIIFSRTATLKTKNDSQIHGLSICSIQCQPSVMRPSSNRVISFNQEVLVLLLHPDMDFCETHPNPPLASRELTPSLQNVFSHVPDIGAEFQAYSTGEARQSVLDGLKTQSAELPDVQHMSQNTLDELKKLIAEYYSSITRATSAALQSYPLVPLLFCPRCHQNVFTYILAELYSIPWSVATLSYAPVKVLPRNLRTVDTHRGIKPD